MRRAHEPEQCDTPPRAGKLAFIVRIVELERIEIIGADIGVGTGGGDVTRVVAIVVARVVARSFRAARLDLLVEFGYLILRGIRRGGARARGGGALLFLPAAWNMRREAAP